MLKNAFFKKTLVKNAPTCLSLSRDMPEKPTKVTDSIPRASVAQVLLVLGFIEASGGKTTFEHIRLNLLQRSQRAAPASRWAMGTVARDVLIDLQKLG